jgi:hypothetical protein
MMSRATPQRVLFYIVADLLWLANVVVCAVALLEFRSTVSVFWLMTGRRLEVLGVANQVILLLGGLIVLVYVLCLESDYRRCVPRLYALLRRVAWTIAIPIGALLASLLAPYIASRFLP